MSNRPTGETPQEIPISTRRRNPKAPPAQAAAPPPEAGPDAATARGPERPDEPGSQPKRDRRAAAAEYRPEYDAPRRKPADARPNAFNPLAWLVEGATGLMEEARHGDLGLSEEFWKHFYAARRESLLAARALIDSLLEQTEREAKRAKEQEARAKRRGAVPLNDDTPA